LAGNTTYKNQFQKENYDRINLIVPKGKKQVIKEFAESKGKSLNGFINEAVDEKMEKEWIIFFLPYKDQISNIE